MVTRHERGSTAGSGGLQEGSGSALTLWIEGRRLERSGQQEQRQSGELLHTAWNSLETACWPGAGVRAVGCGSAGPTCCGLGAAGLLAAGY